MLDAPKITSFLSHSDFIVVILSLMSAVTVQLFLHTQMDA